MLEDTHLSGLDVYMAAPTTKPVTLWSHCSLCGKRSHLGAHDSATVFRTSVLVWMSRALTASEDALLWNRC